MVAEFLAILPRVNHYTLVRPLVLFPILGLGLRFRVEDLGVRV
jgi:hypothetical protein